MGYSIRYIDKVTIASKKYFFDANLWLMILKPPFNLKSRELRYLDFFEKFKTHQTRPKIVVTALLLSEIINRYIKDVSYIQFCKKNGLVLSQTGNRHYKERYRPSADYKRDYSSLCEDIEAFSFLYELTNDDCGTKISTADILNFPPTHLDFNDRYYYLLAKKNDYVIVTDDGDFFVEDVDVITYNNALIDRANFAMVNSKR